MTAPQSSSSGSEEDILERLDDQGLYNKAQRIQMIKDAATEIRRLRGVAQAPIRNDMRALFRNVDDDDWTWLLSHLNDGGRARFWKAVIADVRGALSVSSTQRCTWPNCDQPSGHDYCYSHCLADRGAAVASTEEKSRG
jgi:hypothetical protein